MDRKELVKVLNILKNDKGEQKGFSFRRTIKTLQEAKRNETIYLYWKELQREDETNDE